MLKKCLLMVITLFTVPLYAANLDTPIGEWITISDKTHDKSGIVEIYDEHGQLNGRIVKVFPGKNRSPNDVCQNCPGDFKDKPVQGLEFLWGFSQKNSTVWNNGQLLDPKNGKIYKGSMTLMDGGKKLELRGYWGPFSRKQTWLRAE